MKRISTSGLPDTFESQWAVPINLTVAQLVKIGKQPVQFLAGAQYYAHGPSGPPRWGLRLGILEIGKRTW